LSAEIDQHDRRYLSSGDIPKNGTVFLNLIFSLTILTNRLLYSIKQVYYME